MGDGAGSRAKDVVVTKSKVVDAALESTEEKGVNRPPPKPPNLPLGGGGKRSSKRASGSNRSPPVKSGAVAKEKVEDDATAMDDEEDDRFNAVVGVVATVEDEAAAMEGRTAKVETTAYATVGMETRSAGGFSAVRSISLWPAGMLLTSPCWRIRDTGDSVVHNGIERRCYFERRWFKEGETAPLPTLGRLTSEARATEVTNRDVRRKMTVVPSLAAQAAGQGEVVVSATGFSLHKATKGPAAK
ncbi:hypothetical protein PIB30_061424 [Stylosanthes scabra]|uniref:Uncharacterized protein n=1 Tax=Stylosanthes scabra TaxID=79078 RepID=A0ABU6ZJI7_9FABA|nr:hypothetical protein [Stylosanthes scabra]